MDDDSDSEDDLFTHSFKRKSRPIIDESDDDSSSSDEEDEDEVDDDEDNNVCPICLGEFTDQLIGIPENCKHMFCVDCIQEWTKNVNNCPVDRKKFNSISVLANTNGPVIEKLPIDDPKKVKDVYEDPPTYCLVCGRCDREDSLLLCDECDNGYHMHCLNPPLTTVPIEEWYCEECQPRNAQSASEGISIAQNRWRGLEISISDGENDSYIGDPDVLERVMDKSIERGRDAIARSLILGELARARTAASTRGEMQNDRSTSRNAFSTSTRKSKKGKKRKKTNKTKRPSSKQAVQKAKRRVIERELKKFREKHRVASSSAAPGSSKDGGGECSRGLSTFGDAFNLDEFFGDSDEDDFDIEEAEKREREERSTICNTTDVVGSILGGFGTLDPDNVMVLKDGTVKEKESKSDKNEEKEKKKKKKKKKECSKKVECDKQKQEEEEDKEQGTTEKSKGDENSNSKQRRNSSSSSIKEIVTKNKKRRKIVFADSDSDEEHIDNKNCSKDDGGTSACIEYIDTDDGRHISEYIIKDHKKILRLAEQKLRQGYLEKQKEKKKAEELRKQVQQLLQEGKEDADHKTQASIFSVSKFKIPKKATPIPTKSSDESTSNESNSEKSDKSSAESNDEKSSRKRKKVEKSSNGIPPKIFETDSEYKKVEKVESKQQKQTSKLKNWNDYEPAESKVDLTHRKHNFPEMKKEPLSLEKKVELYNSGKLKKKITAHEKEKKNISKPPQTYAEYKNNKKLAMTEAESSSKLSGKSPIKSILRVKPVSSCAKPPNQQQQHQPIVKKHLSLEDYKNRQFFNDLFGEKHENPKTTEDVNQPNTIQPSDKKNVKFEKYTKDTTEGSLTASVVSIAPPDVVKCSGSVHPSSFANNLRKAKDELCGPSDLVESDSDSDDLLGIKHYGYGDENHKETTSNNKHNDIITTSLTQITTQVESISTQQPTEVVSTNIFSNLIHKVSSTPENNIRAENIKKSHKIVGSFNKPYTTISESEQNTEVECADMPNSTEKVTMRGILRKKNFTTNKNNLITTTSTLTSSKVTSSFPTFDEHLRNKQMHCFTTLSSSSTNQKQSAGHYITFPDSSSIPPSDNPFSKLMLLSKQKKSWSSMSTPPPPPPPPPTITSTATSTTTTIGNNIPIGVVSPQVRRPAIVNDGYDRTTFNQDVKQRGKNAAREKSEQSSGNGMSSTKVEKKLLNRDEYIAVVKDCLKPYYMRGKLTKEQWKTVVKKAVKKIERNQSISSFNSIGRLVKSLLDEHITL